MIAQLPDSPVASPPASAGSTRSRVLADAASGERLLGERGLQGLRAALAAAESSGGVSGWLHFWRAYAAQFDDLAQARSHWLAAEASFREAADARGLDLAACGLVQCTLLDNQARAGFNERAERVLRMPTPDLALAPTPLGLLHLGARLLLKAELRDNFEGVAADVERAFAALGAGIEPEIALRAATAALNALGMALDRVRSEDFFQAGATVAAMPQVGAYSRALWRLLLADSLYYDAAWAPRLRSELDALENLARGHGFRDFQARIYLIRASIALSEGDAEQGRACLAAAHPLLDPAHPPNYWEFHFYKSRLALMTGAAEDAREHVRLSLQLLLDAGVNAARTTPALMQEGYVLVTLGELGEAAGRFARAAELSQGAQAVPCLAHLHLTHALLHWRGGVQDAARSELLSGFAHARSFGLTHFFRALPKIAAELCAAALELDVETPFVGQAIALRALPCPDPGTAAWPWPLRVRTLGGFGIERNGEPIKFGRKAPKRMLDLLRLITALGGRRVDGARVAASLWPDAEGDEARDALKAMLHRTRAFLGADLLLVRDGQISFDATFAWVDLWAFEYVCGRIEALTDSAATGRQNEVEIERRSTQLFVLYRGHFLGEAELQSWALAPRDRLRARFIRCVAALGHAQERQGRLDQAIALYGAAIEQDNLAEALYQRLISCHLARGEHAQALSAYRRCRELLSIVLGVPPSAQTEALVARIGAR